MLNNSVSKKQEIMSITIASNTETWLFVLNAIKIKKKFEIYKIEADFI